MKMIETVDGGTRQREYISKATLLGEYPKLNIRSLDAMVRSGTVKTDPTGKLLDAQQSRELFKDVRDDLPDEFDGWASLIALNAEQKRFIASGGKDWRDERGCRAPANARIWKFVKDGDPGLKGGKLQTKLIRSWDNLGGRVYVRLDDLAAIKRYYNAMKDGPVDLPAGYTMRSEALETFNLKFLIKYSDSPAKQRGLRYAPRPHMALRDEHGKPRPIKSITYTEVAGRQTRTAIAYLTADLDAILDYKPDPTKWRNREEVYRDYCLSIGGSSKLTEKVKSQINSELQYAGEHPRLNADGESEEDDSGKTIMRLNPKHHPVRPTHGKPAAILYWPVWELDALGEYITIRNQLSKPNEANREIRVHVEPDGRRFYPQLEWLALAGLSSYEMPSMSDPRPELGGRPVTVLWVPGRLHRSKHQGHFLYYGFDAENIGRVRRGFQPLEKDPAINQHQVIPAGVAEIVERSKIEIVGTVNALPGKIVVASKSKTVKAKRGKGRPGRSVAEIEADAKVYADWRSSGMRQGEFDRAKNWDEGSTKAACKRHNIDKGRGKFPDTKSGHKTKAA